MPNWVKNTIRVKAEDMPKLKELLLNESKEVDFSKIIPRPKDLEIVSGSFSWIVDKYGFSKETETKQNEIIKPFLDEIYSVSDTQEIFLNKVKEKMNLEIQNKFNKVYGLSKDSNVFEICERMENIIKGYYNLSKYGYKDWYDWSIANWGTKWNASETYVESNQIMFDTAWACPSKVLDKLAESIDFTFAYADENFGSNFGCGETTEDHIIDVDNFSELSESEQFSISYIIFNGSSEDLDECIEYYNQIRVLSENEFEEVSKIVKYYIDID